MTTFLLRCATFFILGAIVTPAFGAAGTTCLCRSEDGKSFVENTHRHSRWACDYKLGYLKSQDANPVARRRPETQTCNAEEITQYKVWACMERGCTYQYARSVENKNKALEKIDQIKGERRP